MNISRRSFIRAGAVATSSLLAAQLSRSASHAIDYAQPVAEAEGLTTYQNGSNVILRWDNLPLLSYRAHPTLKYPYFYPLNGPVSGLSLTAESALPYPHHRGLWLGCDPLNGGNYWADNDLKTGQIHSVELSIDSEETNQRMATIRERCEWKRPDAASPLSDQRRYVITIHSDHLYTIDCDFELHANQDISIKGAKHSFFAMRAASDISPTYGGTLVNSEGGEGAKGTYGKQAKWCGYFGRRRLRPDVVEGIAIMNHPDNFGGRCPWFTREYGHLSPSPLNFLDKPWTMQKGGKLMLKYRVAMHAGTPNEARLTDFYNAWVA